MKITGSSAVIKPTIVVIYKFNKCRGHVLQEIEYSILSPKQTKNEWKLVLKLSQNSDRVCLFCGKYAIGQQKVLKRDDLSFSEALKQQLFPQSETDIPVENSKYGFGFVYNKIKNVSFPNGV